jgi:hypothetical protein
MKNQAAVELGRRGGKARVENQTPEQRKESAQRAAKARWAKLRETVNDITKRSKALEKRATERAKQKKVAPAR